MNLIQSSIASLLLILFVSISGCGPQMAGVETTNGATVVMLDNCVEGSSPPFASVYMFDTGYIPYIGDGLGVVLTADEEGTFHLDGIEEKVLNVQIIDKSKNLSTLLPVGAKGVTYRSELKISGRLQGNVETTGSGRILVFISGTGYYILLKEQGVFSFDNLPPGSYIVQAALLTASENGEKPVLLSSSLKVHATINSDEMTVLKEKIVIP
jgi:hypothetical protein